MATGVTEMTTAALQTALNAHKADNPFAIKSRSFVVAAANAIINKNVVLFTAWEDEEILEILVHADTVPGAGAIQFYVSVPGTALASGTGLLYDSADALGAETATVFTADKVWRCKLAHHVSGATAASTKKVKAGGQFGYTCSTAITTTGALNITVITRKVGVVNAAGTRNY